MSLVDEVAGGLDGLSQLRAPRAEALGDPRVQLLLRVTDFLAVLGLAISTILAVGWLRERGSGPVTLCVGFFAALALVLGARSHMIEALVSRVRFRRCFCGS